MDICQNGWPVLTLSQTSTFLAPNGKLVYCNPLAVNLMAYATWHWHRRVEPLPRATYQTEPNARSGYVIVHAWRPGTKILGTQTFSNHGSGLAADINGHLHPYEFAVGTANYRDGFTYNGRLQLEAIQRELIAYGADMRLGKDFARPRRDAMHFEFWGSRDRMSNANRNVARNGWVFPRKLGDNARLQKVLGVTPDDIVGPRTFAAIAAVQKKFGLKADGWAGARTLSKLGFQY